MPAPLRTFDDGPELAINTDIRTQETLLAASQHDLTTLRHLLRSYSFPDCEPADVQDPETGFSPLHAAIAACDVEESDEAAANGHTNGSEAPIPAGSNGLSEQEELVDGARETIRCLLQNGAIWNQLDKNDETPGCIALRLGLKELYEPMVDAGVRAELLLNRLEGYEQLGDEDDDREMGEDGANGLETSTATPQQSGTVESEQYLSSSLRLSGDKLLDEENNGVMMSWESDIMKRSTDGLLIEPDLKILNVGFGMGIIDGHIQSHPNKPIKHYIIEAHPSVLADMRKSGWYEKSGVTIHEGKWQDTIPGLVAEGQMFDAIYFDTFAESYSQFRDFFSEQVIGLLEPNGKWSFFNGMGADRQISYDVYQKVTEMDLFEAGFDIDWTEIDIPKLDKEWEGVKRKYWNVKKYRLPVCRFMD